jgi:hypothetical protein
MARAASGLARVPHGEAGRGYLELALATRRAALGERHAMVGVSLYQLASAARMRGSNEGGMGEGATITVEEAKMMAKSRFCHHFALKHAAPLT